MLPPFCQVGKALTGVKTILTMKLNCVVYQTACVVISSTINTYPELFSVVDNTN